MYFSVGIHRRHVDRRRRRTTEVNQKQKQKQKKKKKADDMHIPEEVLEQILSRVAVKSVLRFKCVCKAWYNLLSSKDFTFLHLNSYKPCDILIAGIITCPQRTLVSAITVPITRGCAAAATMVNHLLPKKNGPKEEMSDYDLSVGPCNGIFCLHDKDEILLWNPAIYDFKVIPQSNIPCQVPQQAITACTVDLGFDPKTNDFKILHIWYDFSAAYQHQLQLYSLGTNSWRNLDASTFNSFKIHHCSPRFTTNTKIGWFAFDVEIPAVSRRYKVCLFDLSSETFDMIPVPIEGGIVYSTISVFPFGESIAAVIGRPPEFFGCFEIWALNDLSCSSTQSRSWSKLWTIPQLQRPFQRPLGLWGSSYLISLGLKDSDLVLYDLVNQDVVDLNQAVVDLGAGVYKASGYMPAVYRESLIYVSDKKSAAKIVI